MTIKGESSVAEPTFFATPAEWRAWLEANHATAAELLVGFWKVGSGKPSMTWPQSVDEALSFGWIDGVRRSIDDDSYSIRFTPRKPGGNWSKVNRKRFAELKAEGRIRPAGQAAFEVGKPSAYSFERDSPATLTDEETALFQANPAAWAFYETCPPGYRRIVQHWITSAKRPDTRARRLAQLIDVSAGQRRIDFMKPGAER
jgi:uncharacterized protein YdeI (YjbR/CyaY-like superfamily)